MNQKLQIIISLLFIISVVFWDVTLERSESGNSNSITFKAPTEDTSKALRVEIAVTTDVSLTQNSKFFAYCAAHDSGTDVTTLTDPPAFEIDQKWVYASTCDNGAGNSISLTVKDGKYHFLQPLVISLI